MYSLRKYHRKHPGHNSDATGALPCRSHDLSLSIVVRFGYEVYGIIIVILCPCTKFCRSVGASTITRTFGRNYRRFLVAGCFWVENMFIIISLIVSRPLVSKP